MEQNKQNTMEWAYLILRLSLGINMFLHGVMRIPKIDAFSAGMVERFEGTLLSESMVSLFAYSLPYIELALGLLLIIGLFTNRTLLVGGFLIVVLIFGSALQENWSLISSQILYSILFFMLSYFIEFNKYSIDYLRKKA
ncbi:DoxX family membrane protein [Arcobacteraceae bacterium]|nr:DoxX family membrane protein [Arcobacteraceae bacterium]